MLPFAYGVFTFILILRVAMVTIKQGFNKLTSFNHNTRGTKCQSILPYDNYQPLAIILHADIIQFLYTNKIDGLTLESWRHRLGWYIHTCFCEGRACIREKILANSLCQWLISKWFTHTHTHTHTHIQRHTRNGHRIYFFNTCKRKAKIFQFGAGVNAP